MLYRPEDYGLKGNSYVEKIKEVGMTSLEDRRQSGDAQYKYGKS